MVDYIYYEFGRITGYSLVYYIILAHCNGTGKLNCGGLIGSVDEAVTD